MSHVEKGTLQAWLDGELRESDRSGVETHAASCAVCQAELRSLREAAARAHDALAGFGYLPVADFGTLGEIRKRSRTRRRILPAGLARAAMLLLAFAGLVSAALPGSPLRRWIDELGEPDATAEETVAPEPTRPVGQGGVFVRPDQGTVVIRLSAESTDLVVRLVDAAEAGVVWVGSDAGVRTRQTAGLLDVSGLPDGPVTVTIPRSVLQARVEVNGRVWWEKSGPDVRVPGPVREERGDEVFFQTGG